MDTDDIMKPPPTTPAAATTVYYNSACPVCDAGIRGQRARMQGCDVRWVDVHTQPESVAALGSTLEQVRERLHVRDADGAMHIGDQAVAALLAQTPRWRWLAWVPRHLRFLTGPLYNLIAKHLYRWNRRRGHW